MKKATGRNEREQSCLTCSAFSPGCEEGCTFDIPEADEVITKASILAKRKRMKEERTHAVAKAVQKLAKAEAQTAVNPYEKKQKEQKVNNAKKALAKVQKHDERRKEKNTKQN